MFWGVVKRSTGVVATTPNVSEFRRVCSECAAALLSKKTKCPQHVSKVR